MAQAFDPGGLFGIDRGLRGATIAIIRIFLCMGGLCINTGQREKVHDSLRIAEANFREMGMAYWLTKTQEQLARL
ncbi:hypothetical protein ACFL0Q_04345 [Thermodesulfobacteriota bacterium]